MTGASTYRCLIPTACALAACSSSSSDGVPDMPSYARDVEPIFASHCVACHGAGGMLNAAPNPDGSPNTVGAPSLCYLSMYDDSGDCAADGGIVSLSCERGAHFCAMSAGNPPASYIGTYALALSQDEGGMPPAPWPALGTRDREVLTKWLQDPIP